MTLNRKLIGKIQAIILIILGIGLLLPCFVGLYYGEEKASHAFLGTAMGSLLAGGILLLLFRPERKSMTPRDGYLAVCLTWLIASLVGAIPFTVSGVIPNYADAIFEAVSGFTTTGATILSGIDGLPKSVLFWRSALHWLGGMGILVFAIALLPSLGISGTQLMAAESTGPTKDKILSTQSKTAKLLYLIYIGLTVLEFLLLKLGHMTTFDALNHALSTMGTGGFSTHDLSVAYYNSPYIEWVITVFMILAGTKFPVFFFLVRRRFSEIRKDAELKLYLGIWLGFGLLTALILGANGVYDSLGTTVRYALFETASLLTTTGFGLADYNLWPQAVRMLMFLLLFMGGCAGSTAGGIKTIRILGLFKIIRRGLYSRIHPRAVVPIKIGGKVMRPEAVHSVENFLFLYFILWLFGAFVVSLSGVTFETAITASLTALSNVGPGLGQVGPAETYAFFPVWTKLFLALYMLIGRLELFTVMILLVPAFWNPNR